MDAAHTLKKTALFLSAALTFAATSLAQISVSPTTVSLTSSSLSATVTVTGSGAFSVTGITPSSPAWFSVSPMSGTATSTGVALTVALTRDCTFAGCTGSFTVGSQTVTVNYTTGGGGGGGGGGNGTISASPNPVTVVPNSSASLVTITNNTSSQVTLSISNGTQTWGPVISYASNTIAANGSLQLQVYAFGYQAGQPTSGTFTVTPNGNSAAAITVTVNLSNTPTSGGLVASPSQVTLGYPASSSAPSFAYVSVTNANGNNSANFYGVASTQSGGQWLYLSPAGLSSTTSSTISIGGQFYVFVNTGVASQLSTGTYTGTVTLYDAGTNQALGSLTVYLSVNGASGPGTGGVAGPSSLAFAYQSGGQPPSSYQTIVVNGTISNVTFANSSSNWPTGTGVTAAQSTSNLVLVAVSGGITTADTYTGSVTITSSTGTVTIPVTLTVSPANTPIILVSPGDFACAYTVGQTNSCGGYLSVIPSDNSLATISVSSSASWVQVSPTTGVGRSAYGVTIDPTSLANGINNATITVTSTGTISSTTAIPVAVLVNGSSSGGGTLTFTQNNTSINSLSFNTSTSSTQTFTVTATNGTATSFSMAYGVSTPSGGNWLAASTSSIFTPATVTVTVSPSGLTAGQTYTGYINFTPSGGTTQTVTVTLTVSSTGGNITVTSGNTGSGSVLGPNSGLTLSAQAGGPSQNAAFYVASASGSAQIPFTITWTPTNSWLTVSGSSGATPSPFTVTANPTGLSANTYTGSITVTPTGGAAVTFPVTFTVTPAATISASPTSLTFNYSAGGSAPSAQSVTISATSGTLNWSATATSNGSWLQISPASGSTPGNLAVSVTNLSSLTPSSTPYTGTITITGTTSGGAAAGSQTINVSLTVTAPLPTVLSVTNAASFNTGAISAGEIITIFGTSLGPSTGVSATPTNGLYPTTLGGVQVLVGGYPAPMIYAVSGQVSAIVPYEINRPVYLQNVNVYVKYLNQTSNGVSLAQAASAPGLFTANASGSGPGAILNSDLSVNTSTNPAAAGSTVVLYLTGEGQTQPPGVSGKVTSGTAPYTVPVLTPTVTIGGHPAAVQFYAEAPTLVSGVLQINVQIPAGTPSGPQPVVVTLGTASSQMTSAGIGAVTVAVK